MEQRLTLVTLGVRDLDRARSFYAALGWVPALDVQETLFYETNGAVLTLWSREKLAEDTGVADTGATWSGITLAHNARSREEVDAIVAAAREAGAEVAREPAETFYGGYAGVFRDPDGHAWEVAHNPGFGLDERGNVVLPRAEGG